MSGERVRDFLGKPAPPNYVAGACRGDRGFVTAPDIVPDGLLPAEGASRVARRAPAARREEDPDAVFAEVESYLDSRRKKAVEETHSDELLALVDKDALRALSESDWAAVVSTGDRIVKRKRVAREEDRFVAERVIVASEPLISTTVVDADAESTAAGSATTMAELLSMRDAAHAALKIAPHSEAAWVTAARADAAAGRPRAAVRTISAALDRHPMSAAVWLVAAELAAPEERAQILRNALSCVAQAEASPVWLALVDAVSDAERLDVLADAVVAVPQSDDLWIRLAASCGDLQRRKLFLTKAVACCPQSSILWTLHIRSLLQAGDADSVASASSSALDACPDSPELLIAVLCARERLGNSDLFAGQPVPDVFAKMATETAFSAAEQCLSDGFPRACGAILKAVTEVLSVDNLMSASSVASPKLKSMIHKAALEKAQDDETRVKVLSRQVLEAEDKVSVLMGVLQVMYHNPKASEQLISDNKSWLCQLDAFTLRQVAIAADIHCTARSALLRLAIKRAAYLRQSLKFCDSHMQEPSNNCLCCTADYSVNALHICMHSSDCDSLLALCLGLGAPSQNILQVLPRGERMWCAMANSDAQLWGAALKAMPKSERIIIRAAFSCLPQSRLAAWLIERKRIADLDNLACEMTESDMASSVRQLANVRTILTTVNHADGTSIKLVDANLSDRGNSQLQDARAKIARGRALLEQARTRMPSSTSLWQASVRYEVAAGQLDAARSLVERAVARCPTDGSLQAMSVALDPTHSRRARLRTAKALVGNDVSIALIEAQLTLSIDDALALFENIAMMHPNSVDAAAFCIHAKRQMSSSFASNVSSDSPVSSLVLASVKQENIVLPDLYGSSNTTHFIRPHGELYAELRSAVKRVFGIQRWYEMSLPQRIALLADAISAGVVGVSVDAITA